jgi:hypothetical protein
MTVNWALKEWQAAVTALLQGETVLLLRKGGIRESGGQFQVASRQVLLLPTCEHQQAHLLKPEFQSLMEVANQDSDGDSVIFTGWATITHVFCLQPPSMACDLLPHLIWNRSFVDDRLQWRPDRPLYAMALRAYRLPSPVELPRHRGYTGCRSWVELGESVNTQGSTPVLAEAAYQTELASILALLPQQVVV